MDRARHLRNYGLHSWFGMVLGLFVYVVAFTGCLALFHGELLSWEDPAKRLPVAQAPAPIDAIFKAWVEETGKGEEVIEFARLIYPNEHEPYYQGGVNIHDVDGNHVFVEQKWDTQTGAPLDTRTEALSLWLLDFHRDLMWPQGLGGRTVGRTIVGIAGIILMLSILTGVIAHTKIVQEFFTLRYFRSVRLKWQDTHKVVGLWGLPFFTMIAFTGAVLGVVAILAPIVALLTFKGDQQALLDEVLGKAIEPAGVSAPMLSMDAVASLSHLETGEVPRLVTIENWGDVNARMELFYPTTELLNYAIVEIDGVSGEVIADSPAANLTTANKGVAMMTPLHYGTYGGIWLKFLYFVLGFALAVITVFGLMMWIERRLHGNEGAKSQAFYRRLSHMVTGVAVGLPLASVAIFWLDKLYIGAESARLFWTGTTYFAVWALALGYAFIRRQDYRTTRELIGLTGGLLAGLPALNAVMTGDTLLGIFGAGHAPSAWVDVVLLVSGIAILAVAWRLPKARQNTKKTRKTVVAPSSALSPAE
ncbi:MAG: PepSY-associated TM helix domain-containing protein [Pseudomonadota bacterium]